MSGESIFIASGNPSDSALTSASPADWMPTEAMVGMPKAVSTALDSISDRTRRCSASAFSMIRRAPSASGSPWYARGSATCSRSSRLRRRCARYENASTAASGEGKCGTRES